MSAKAVIIIVVVGIFLASCENDKTINAAGRIAYIYLEGGFYGIVGDDGVSYDPVNLPEDFQQDSLRVVFEGKILTDRISFHMWGKLIELKHIERLR